ncbi:thioredoxin family protein [Silvibacterium sp.]|uniref:thioredoxin family protein n=1 Tax=Silvibacterium sp. TaxID=1964179 RepID=UPI0039E33F51
MSIAFHSRTRKYFTLKYLAGAALALALACVAIRPPHSFAQDGPNIIGTQPLPGLSGATGWLNSKPLTAKDLKGKVVLIDFWDYSCINCIRAVPYVRAWADKYKDSGLVVIGVHTPEFDVEKLTPNVERAVKKFDITYPVAIDSDMRIWNAFSNQYWPAHYLIDAKGHVRYQHFGEGEYDETEKQIQELLKEAHATSMPTGIASVHGEGAQAAADTRDVRSPETYLGYERAENFVSPGGLKHNVDRLYAEPKSLDRNDWGLIGQWADQGQAAVLRTASGKIVYRFHARDLHMVLAPGADGKPVHFKVTIDGQAPGENHGTDTDAQGNGVVTEDRLYQLIRQKGSIADHTFTIEFEEPGVQAFTFTFG